MRDAQSQGHEKTAPLRHEGACGYAFHLHAQHIDEQQRHDDVHDVLHYGDDHGRARVLHADEPAVQRKQRQRGRCPPDADIKIDGGEPSHLVGGRHDIKAQLAYGYLKQQQTGTQQESHEQRMPEQPMALGHIATSKRLRRKSTGAHTKESKQPVHHVEQHAAHGNGSDVGCRTQMARDGHVDKSQQRHGDVAHNAGYGDAQNLAVARCDMNLFHLCLSYLLLSHGQLSAAILAQFWRRTNTPSHHNNAAKVRKIMKIEECYARKRDVTLTV